MEQILEGLVELLEAVGFLHSTIQVFNATDESTEIVEKLEILLEICSDLRDQYQMKLHNPTPNVLVFRTCIPGRPQININEEQVRNLRLLGMQWKKIASLLGVSQKTLMRNRQSFSTVINYSDLSDAALDGFVREIFNHSPRSGEKND